MPFLFFQLSIKRNPESSRLGLDLLNLMLAQFQFIIRQSLAKYSEYAPEVVFIQSEISHSQLLHRPISAKYHASKLAPGKSDPVFSFSTDCFKHAPDLLFEHVSLIIQSCLVHCHVTQILLLATLVPLIKDKLGPTNISKNYRSIAISSILLKLIDWVFIILFGTNFALNDFQFAYQAGCSTTMCTWAVLETVDYFLKNDSEVFTCAMDMTALNSFLIWSLQTNLNLQ